MPLYRKPPVMILRAIFVAAISLVAFPACAVTTAEPALSLVDQFALAIEDIDNVSKRCGITRELIESAIRYPILRTGLKIAPSSDAILDVEMVSSRFGAICDTSYKLELDVLAPVSYKGKSFVGYVVLWGSGGDISSPSGEHASRMRNMLEQQAKDLVVNWSQVKSGDYLYKPMPGSIPH
jgi:hypothetical protein